MNIGSRIRQSALLVGNAYLRPAVVGRYVNRSPRFGGALGFFLAAQSCIVAWLVSQNALLRISPAGILLPVSIPLRTLVTLSFGTIFLSLCTRIAGKVTSWRTSASIIVHAGMLFLLGDFVKTVLHFAWTPASTIAVPSLAAIVSAGGLAGAWLREAHIIAAAFVATTAMMVRGAARTHPAVSWGIALAVWGAMTAFRISFIQVLAMFVR